MKTRHPINNYLMPPIRTTEQIKNKALKFNRRVD